ncbi:hypothetical protein E4U55_002081 [Claviceps digitariae]|nr:hypothetical protein E4U55_002081 [Claviceps digitariae]
MAKVEGHPCHGYAQLGKCPDVKLPIRTYDEDVFMSKQIQMHTTNSILRLVNGATQCGGLYLPESPASNLTEEYTSASFTSTTREMIIASNQQH